MAIANRDLPVGNKLWANYKKHRYVCTVEAGEEEGSVAFVLEDGSRHKSPSAAASKVMGGKAVNGWRFWTVEGDEPPPTEKPKPDRKPRSGGRKKQPKTIFKTESQADAPAGQVSYFCSACMQAFPYEGTDEPVACPQGHRNNDPELDAPASVSAAEEA